MTGGSLSNRMRRDTPFRVHIDLDNAVVAAFGELDMVTVDELDAALRQALEGGSRRLVLDLRGLTFMDSQGLHLVIGWSSLAEKCGVAFTIIQGGPAVRRLFEIVGLLDRLPFVDSIGDGPAASAREAASAEAEPLRIAEPSFPYSTAIALDVLPRANGTGSQA
jgi:anti-sigma B factor antagonist